MKKIALFCAVAAVALGVIAGDGAKFKFSSSGDTYADGTAVLDGEVYALVWVADGAGFAGFNADGTLVDPVNNALECVSVAQGGGCVKTVFIADEHAGGTYGMYLLDTRMDVADEAGNVTKKVAGLTDGAITVVNKAIAVNDPELDLAATETSTVDGEAAVAAGDVVVSAAVAEADIPQPVVTKFTPADGGVVLWVAGTVPYVQYRVYGGTSLTDITTPLANFLNGNAGGELVLKVGDVDDNKFFKVVTK